MKTAIQLVKFAVTGLVLVFGLLGCGGSGSDKESKLIDPSPTGVSGTLPQAVMDQSKFDQSSFSE